MTVMASFQYLQDLPPELKGMIFWCNFDQDPIDITVRLPFYGQASKLQRGFPPAIADMHGLL